MGEKKKLERMIMISEILSSQSLVVPIRVFFLLSCLVTESQISILKMVFMASVFILEVPTGYLADKYGNRNSVIMSKASMIASLLVFCSLRNIWGFMAANVLLGLSAALGSGAQNTYFMEISEEVGMDYVAIKIKIAKYIKVAQFIFMLLSSALYMIDNALPFILTSGMYTISLIIILKLPKFKVGEIKSGETMMSKSWSILKKIISNKNLLQEILFYTICTAILIANFDYYAVFFEKAGINKWTVGIIYAAFMLINMLGVHIYSMKDMKKRENIFFLMLPISFLLVRSESMVMMFLGIIIQQTTFAYFSIHFDVYVIKSLDSINESSHFQSMISFLNSLLRIGILGVIALILKFVKVETLYLGFSGVMLITICTNILVSRSRKEESVEVSA